LNFGPTRLGVQFETGWPEGRERMVAVKRHLGKMFGVLTLQKEKHKHE
jgi:hypothetical protein